MLVGSLLIIKLLKQLIKRRGGGGGEPNRLQIAINVRCIWGGERETPPY